MRPILKNLQSQGLSRPSSQNPLVPSKLHGSSAGSYFLLFLFCFSWSWVQAQKTFKGQVLDATDQSALEGVSVYFDGSSLGTITNAQGYFELQYPTSLNAPLVISYLGYATRSIEDLQQLKEGVTAKIYLEELAVALEEVVLEPDTWSRERKYRIFKRSFLGEDAAGQRAKILNPEVLRFYYNKAQATLYAYASAPIQIANKYLGYLVQYELLDFELSFYTDTVTQEWPEEYIVYYSGTSFYSPLSLQTKAKYERHRAQIFEGSALAFMRSLIQGRLKADGYRFFYERKEVDPELFIDTKREGELLQVTHKVPRLSILFQKRQSVIEATKGPYYVDELGNFSPAYRISFGGYMGSKRVAAMLPLDYGLPEPE